MILTIDFETRSRVDLKKVGAYVYAAHPSTEILCLAYKIDSNTPEVLTPKRPSYLTDDLKICGYLNHVDVIQAHNMNFERCIWREIMVKRYGFPDLPLAKLECTAAKCSYFALPRSLEKACEVLDLPRKDLTGHCLMLKMCKPLPANAKLRKEGKEWLDDEESLSRLYQYCMQDVEAEYALSQALPGKMPESELALWRLDQEINDRGIYVDLPAIKAIEFAVDEEAETLQREVPVITKNAVQTTGQREAILAWLKTQGLQLDNLQKENVALALEIPYLADNVRRILEIRRAAGKISIKKLTAMRERANGDCRVRGTMMYYGAERTGRWAGRGIQPHNMPRDSDIEAPEAFQFLDSEDIALLYGTIAAGASKAVRPCIRAPEGKELLCGDFNAIEGRILAWLAGEKEVLQHYLDGLEMYKMNAVAVFAVDYEAVTSDQRQIGKVIELACGYQGWVNAFAAMGKSYGVSIPEEEAAEHISRWRGTRQKTVQFWRGMNAAAIQAVQTGKPKAFRGITFGLRGEWLHMRLPSGRLLSYYDPKISREVDLYEREKDTLSFMGLENNQWVRIKTYGGKLAENATQAIARDFLAEALVRVNYDFDIVFHVHDEIVCEVPPGQNYTEAYAAHTLDSIMSETPEWAQGCPVAVESWQGKRYRK